MLRLQLACVALQLTAIVAVCGGWTQASAGAGRGLIAIAEGDGVYDVRTAVVAADGSRLRTLTPRRQSSFPSSWSPDGKELAYSVQPQPGIENVWVMNANGSDKRQLTHLPAGNDANAAKWSPDGKKIAYFVRTRHGDDGNVWVMNADGSGAHALTQKTGWGRNDPTWSPDGGQIAYTDPAANNTAGSIGIFDLATGTERRLNPPIGSLFQYPAWSPNGEQLTFFVAPDGRNARGARIGVINADGTGFRFLTSPHLTAVGATWSPNGKQLAFDAFPSKPGDHTDHVGIYVMNADGSGLRRVAPHGQYPTWSPNGKQIAFTYNHVLTGNKQVSDYQVVAPDGRSLRRIVRVAGAIELPPLWQP
jgi:TolB protein